jgi:hypothetical protein
MSATNKKPPDLDRVEVLEALGDPILVGQRLDAEARRRHHRGAGGERDRGFDQRARRRGGKNRPQSPSLVAGGGT